MVSISAEEAFETISLKKPKLVYISGKTSTGKSTFARKLKDGLRYSIIELESALLDVISEQGFDEQLTFQKVLTEPGDFVEKNLFLKATDKLINEALAKDSHIVVEGAVANVETLARILSPVPHFHFIYFHPKTIEPYVRNLTKRFMVSNENSNASLPLKFWELIDKNEFSKFCRTKKLTPELKKAINTYAYVSQSESTKRLELFRKNFSKITVVEVT